MKPLSVCMIRVCYTRGYYSLMWVHESSVISDSSKQRTGLLLKYRLSCALLQKHLNLRWQECVQLISSTVAPSSGFLLHHNTQHCRKRAGPEHTLKRNQTKRGCPSRPCSLSLVIVPPVASSIALPPYTKSEHCVLKLTETIWFPCVLSVI